MNKVDIKGTSWLKNPSGSTERFRSGGHFLYGDLKYSH